MKSFAIICLLTVASAIQSKSRHAGLEIYKRTLPKPNGIGPSASPKKQRETALQRTSSLQRTKSLDRTRSAESSGSFGRQEASQSAPRVTGIDQQRDSSRSRPSPGSASRTGLEVIHSGNGIGHSPLPPLVRENPVPPQGLPRIQTPERSRSGNTRQNSQSFHEAITGRPGPGSTGTRSFGMSSGALHRTDAHFTNRPPPNQGMSRSNNPIATAANSAVSWVDRNPTTALFGGCAVAGACLTGAGVSMLAAGAGATQTAGLFTTGIGGSLTAGTAAAGGAVYASGLDDFMSRPMGMHRG